MITLNASYDTADRMISELKQLFPALVSGGPLPPMQEQPKRDEPAPAEPVKRTRKTKEEKEDAGEQTTLKPAPAAETNSSGASTQATASTDQAAQASADGAASGAEVDIDTVRAKLKTLGATDGLGHDKVFEVLGHYDAKNASGVPAEKRGALVAEIDALLAGAK